MPSKISPGYRRMQDYLDDKITEIEKELNEMVKDKHYEAVVLRNASN